MFALELNEDGLLRGEVILYFASGNYHRNVFWSIGLLIYILEYPPKIANVRYFNNLCWKYNFVKLCHNRFLKNIFEATLRCTVSTVGETHETILLITGGDLEPLQQNETKLLVSIVCNFQPLTMVTKNSILDNAAPKLYFILICFCFK